METSTHRSLKNSWVFSQVQEYLASFENGKPLVKEIGCIRESSYWFLVLIT